MSSEKVLDFKTHQEWGHWLQQHHRSDSSVWLTIHKKQSGSTGLRYEEAVEEALCFGWIDGKMKSVDQNTFILRFSVRKPASIWSVSNRDRALKLIESGQMTKAGLAKIEEARRSGKWDQPVSVEQMTAEKPVPKDLEEALKTNHGAWEGFSRFSNSNRYMYIYWVTSAKKAETRANRIQVVVTNAKKGITLTEYSFGKRAE
jgi:uncharacterized protein YdeI (YjbR/CyaY-like superfamily)